MTQLPEAISVTVDITLKDLMAANFIVITRNVLRMKRMWIFYAVLLAVLAIATPFNHINSLTWSAWCAMCGVASWLPLFLIGFIPAMCLIVPWLTYSRNKPRFQNVVTAVSPENLSAEGNDAGISFKYGWSAISGVERRGSFIFIQISAYPPFDSVIPVHCFESPEKADDFYKAAHTYWQAAKSPSASKPKAT